SALRHRVLIAGNAAVDRKGPLGVVGCTRNRGGLPGATPACRPRGVRVDLVGQVASGGATGHGALPPLGSLAIADGDRRQCPLRTREFDGALLVDGRASQRVVGAEIYRVR